MAEQCDAMISCATCLTPGLDMPPIHFVCFLATEQCCRLTRTADIDDINGWIRSEHTLNMPNAIRGKIDVSSHEQTGQDAAADCTDAHSHQHICDVLAPRCVSDNTVQVLTALTASISHSSSHVAAMCKSLTVLCVHRLHTCWQSWQSITAPIRSSQPSKPFQHCCTSCIQLAGLAPPHRSLT